MAIEMTQPADGVALAQQVADREAEAQQIVRTAIGALRAADDELNLLAAERFDEARQEAVDVDDMRRPLGPLSGVPCVVSDDGIAVKGLPLTHGSALCDPRPTHLDSALAKRYRASGLVVLGSARTSEFSLWPATATRAGGAVRHPKDAARNAGGACGGAAAAVASGAVPIAQAVDVLGGLRISAASCGVVGLKPTRGRVPFGPLSDDGWAGLRSVHVLTRSVRDSAAVLDITAGAEPGSLFQAPLQQTSWVRLLNRAPRPLRIAVASRTPTGSALAPAAQTALDRAAASLAAMGHEIFEAEPRFPVDPMIEAVRVIVGAHLTHAIDQLHAVPCGCSTSEREELLTAPTRHWLEDGRQLSPTDYPQAIGVVTNVARRFAAFFEEFDLALSPVIDGVAPLANEFEAADEDLETALALTLVHAPFTAAYNLSGCPAISLPAGTSDGLPTGVQLGAGFGREDLLLTVAAQLESAFAG